MPLLVVEAELQMKAQNGHVGFLTVAETAQYVQAGFKWSSAAVMVVFE